jgi:hypothetical protein
VQPPLLVVAHGWLERWRESRRKPAVDLSGPSGEGDD